MAVARVETTMIPQELKALRMFLLVVLLDTFAYLSQSNSYLQ